MFILRVSAENEKIAIIILYRLSCWKQYTFFEFLVHANQFCLEFHCDLDSRYKSRIDNCFSYYLDGNEIRCIHVKSSMHSFAQNINKETKSVWIVKHDFEKKGEFIPENIMARAQFMGFSISEQSCYIMDKVYSYILSKHPNVNISPLSLYHGTNALQEIIANGYQQTFGMLGNGVYLGTVWKALRFAFFGKLYERNEIGYILRNLVFTENLHVLPNTNWKCNCCNSLISDHVSIWKSKNFDGVHARQCTELKLNNKCDLRNEEWIILPEKILISSWSKMINLHQQYNPLNRVVSFF